MIENVKCPLAKGWLAHYDPNDEKDTEKDCIGMECAWHDDVKKRCSMVSIARMASQILVVEIASMPSDDE
jgi:hypothetical protein